MTLGIKSRERISTVKERIHCADIMSRHQEPTANERTDVPAPPVTRIFMRQLLRIEHLHVRGLLVILHLTDVSPIFRDGKSDDVQSRCECSIDQIGHVEMAVLP